MDKLTRQIRVRMTEAEYEHLQRDALGFKSVSYYIRERLRSSLEGRSQGKGYPESASVEKRSKSPSHKVKAPGKVSRNAPCPCGSGKKFKRCCAP